jgi:hypothetical protein
LFLHPFRTFTYVVRANTTGNKVNSVQLVTPDFNNTNNKDNETVSVLTTCGDPFGTGTRPACPSGAVYGGNNSITMVSADLFNATCCVSPDGAGRAGCDCSRVFHHV